MIMSAFGWIKRRLKDEAPLWGIVIVLMLSLVAYISPKSVDAKLSDPFLSIRWSLAVLGSIGGIVVTSIIAGVVLKVLATQKYFTDAIAEVIYGEKGLDEMPEEQRQKLWKSLTRRIYVPNINKSINDYEVEMLYNSIAAVSGRQIEYHGEFFIRDMIREIELGIDPTNPRNVVLKDFFRAKIIPFDPVKEVCWTSIRRVKAGQNIQNVQNEVTQLKIDGSDPNRISVDISDDNTSETTKYTLSGHNFYNITRDRKQTWNVAEDPQFVLTTPYIIWGGSFKISNNIPDFKIVFTELGGREIFRIISGNEDVIPSGENIRRDIADIMLPKRGFLLTILPSVSTS